MNIFACIKQVPSIHKVQVDEMTGVLSIGLRPGAPGFAFDRGVIQLRCAFVPR